MSHTLKHPTAKRSALVFAILLFAGSLQAQNIVIQNQSVTEGDVGTVNMDFPITINPVSAMPITLNYSTGAVGADWLNTGFGARLAADQQRIDCTGCALVRSSSRA